MTGSNGYSSALIALIYLISAIVTVWFAYLVTTLKKELTDLHVMLNSKMDKLLQLTATSSRAEGRLAGIAEEVERQLHER